ncbi:MAG TPA: phosphatase PAP2 family protein [Acidimicrobiia bacterium]|nr:phosphatase PAP2 family protein [Acidimicrobiia bacterium]
MAVFLVAVPFVLLLTQVVLEGPVTRWDASTARSLTESVRGVPPALALMRALSFLGHPVWLGVLGSAVGAYIWFRTRRRRPVIFIALTGSLGGLLGTAVKLLVGRPRPELDEPLAHAFGKSFPSGHAMASLVIYGALVLVVLPLVAQAWRPVLVAATSLVVLGIGVSRLVLGVHFITDVIGGWVLGAAWLSASTAAFSIWRVQEGDPPVHPSEGVEPELVEKSLAVSRSREQ